MIFTAFSYRCLILTLAVGCIILHSSTVQAQNSLITFYQQHISPIDGDRCAMSPSCSVYAAQALKTHGPVLGWILTCDRLVRCGRDEGKVADKVIINRQIYIHDPLQANTSWWFEKADKE